MLPQAKNGDYEDDSYGCNVGFLWAEITAVRLKLADDHVMY
jgi:hypothetical protein